MIALFGGLMFPPIAASVHGLRMGCTRMVWVCTQWSVLQVCLNLALCYFETANGVNFILRCFRREVRYGMLAPTKIMTR